MTRWMMKFEVEGSLGVEDAAGMGPDAVTGWCPGQSGGGGLDAFLRVIEEEVKPFVMTRYRVDPAKQIPVPWAGPHSRWFQCWTSVIGTATLEHLVAVGRSPSLTYIRP